MTDTNRDICIRLNQEVFGQGKVELAEELVAPDFVDHEAPAGAPTGPASVRGTVSWIRSGLDDVAYEVEDSVAEGDRVVLRVTMAGTHARDFLGQPATGKRVTMKQIHIFRMADGKVAEHWAARDDLGMIRQLGGR